MEQVLKKPFWKIITQAHNQFWRKSVRWPFLLAVSGSVLVVMVFIYFGIQIFAPGSATGKTGDPALVVTIAAGILLWLISTLIVYLCLDRLILRRIEALRKGTGQINSGDFQHRLPVEHADEFGMLAEQINILASGLNKRETMLARASEKALSDSRFKSDLLASVSHDLRQPLGVILGFSEMIRDETIGPVTNPQRRAINEIIASTARLSQMVTELLDSSRMEAHNLGLRIDNFSPSLLLRQLQDQASPAARHKGLELITELDPGLPKTLCGDAARLLLILNNLTVNAIKFTEQGSVHIRLFQPEPDHWAISVADTGQGIPADALEHIFEPFWQANDPATRDKGGVGLGLSIVQQLVQLMDGHIEVESAVGVGSTFRVTLPLDHTLLRGE
jgi:signal transduction histidine kinase